VAGARRPAGYEHVFVYSEGKYHMATATKPSPVLTHQHATNQHASNLRGIPAARFATVVDRTSELSDEVLTSLQAGQHAAIEAVGRFVVTIEEGLPEEVNATSEVAKKITESGLEVVQQLSHTLYHVLRQLIDSTGKSLSGRDGTTPIAVR
jgi:hypothetical protein